MHYRAIDAVVWAMPLLNFKQFRDGHEGWMPGSAQSMMLAQKDVTRAKAANTFWCLKVTKACFCLTLILGGGIILALQTVRFGGSFLRTYSSVTLFIVENLLCKQQLTALGRQVFGSYNQCDNAHGPILGTLSSGMSHLRCHAPLPITCVVSYWWLHTHPLW